MWTIASAFVFFALPLKGLASEIGQDASDELVHTEPVKLDDDSDTASEFLLAGGVHPLKTSRSDAEDFTRETAADFSFFVSNLIATKSRVAHGIIVPFLYRRATRAAHFVRRVVRSFSRRNGLGCDFGRPSWFISADNPTRFDLDAWQIDVEGAAIVRLDAQDKQDLESGDYRFGLLWTGKRETFLSSLVTFT